MREETAGGAAPGAARDRAARGPSGDGAADRFPDSIESRSSWAAAMLVIGILSISYGAPLIVVVGLKPIAASLASDRSVVALAAALVWVGTGSGGILMGWVADRVGVRRTVIFGALMTALGLAVSSIGKVWTLYLGHALLIGFLGGGALYPPLLIYVSRWFDRRRGAALALISSGQYVAGVVWPSVFQRWLGWFGWQATMLSFAIAVVAIVPLAMILRPAPKPGRAAGAPALHFRGARALGLRPNSVQALLCAAGFLCCVPMAMPSSHLVAL
ncbi:MAG TPA: MFS transporter, partial [Stellaceae bacterium]|nr:MFS transporter [Stellaceae bacterium]